MMDNLRAAANHVVLKIILALIILSFVLTGVGNYLIGGSGDYAAKVNGQTIERAQLEQAFQSERSRMQQQLGDQFSALAGNEGYMQQMRRQVLSQLIDNMLLDQYAKKLGLSVSDDQIKDAIRKAPYFQTNGQFDNAKYLDLIGRMGYTADNFAQSMRQQLVNQQVIQAFGESGFVLPSESQAMAALVLQERDVRLATIDLKALQAKQSVSDDELKAYYDQNKNSFIAPEQLKVSYIPMDAASMQDKVKVTDADISAYYDQHKSSYGQPERKNYSVIQLKTEAEANAVLDELKKGGDFATLAKDKSTDIISRRTGGELGWLEPETTADELKQANLTEKGQLSGVVKSSVGYLVVRLNDIEPEKVKPLSEVHDAIAKQVQQEKAVDAYYALQQKVSEAATSDNESLASAEEAAGVKAAQTDWFTRDQIPAALNFKPVVQALFDGSLIGENGAPGSNSDVITVDGDRAFVVRVSGHKPEGIEPFDQVKDRVAELVKRNKAVQEAKLQGEKLLVELKQGKGDEAMKAAGLSFGSVQKMARAPEDSQLVESVFALPHPQEGKPVYGMSQDRQDNVVLIALDAVNPGTLPADEMKTFVGKMQEGATGVSFDSLLASLRKDAKIKMGAAEQQPQ
ncbi:Peptidyl-prolyl cis-trans isomerase D [Serratia entomophila]|jgi:peptidyl-prolyl cis-trans isomerase D|uniref:peptidylprolyl isomerase n=1 Tax=Serratia entomophila TaxID=42906 RepID=UPI00217C9B49|nr:peptidylprolyl isomerase [Serratia entomophila]CAI0886313.1 Peptidyl-prolyl cis-trans isomerase D [Serratia entomophila]CAI0908343.1 Peptidyl-prolyl cis-trans isomerase D [Serratia entomophila]CAI0947260.1 Peptidyl-prolyl cis-trans isomerase D [Serratia entomophila]CAI0972813.1 Peptidyl-prolyl cis-trans isomerase D [Serratia entomophila]CAI1672000.1 Peptidyl-prolyl cis-trans isomerase D [Serratia entomophila]